MGEYRAILRRPMNVLLVGPRGDGEHERMVRSRLSRLAAAAAAGGDAVTLLDPGETPMAVESAAVTVIAAPSHAPSFRRVEAQLVDVPLERALTSLLRHEPPGIVHVDGFGGSTSYLVPWLCDRLGVPAVVVAAPLERVLCHRGTLVDQHRSACTRWDDAERCARCCRAPSDDGLDGFQSALAALCRPLRGLSPFPHRTAFANRLDMIAQGLCAARVVCAADAHALEALVGLGVPERIIRIGIPDGDLTMARELWRVARQA